MARITGLERVLAEHDRTVIVPVAEATKRAHLATIRLAIDKYLAEYTTAAEAFTEVVARGIALGYDFGFSLSGLQSYKRISHPQLSSETVASVERRENDLNGRLVIKLIADRDPEAQRFTKMANDMATLATQIQESIRAEDQRREREAGKTQVLYV